MKRSFLLIRWPILAALGALLGTALPAFADSTAAVKSLHALFESAWQRDLEESPISASYYGDQRYADRLDDISLAAIHKSHAGDRKVLEDLAKIRRADLPAAEQLNYDLFERIYRERVAVVPFKNYVYPSHQQGVQSLNEVSELLQFATVKDYDNWLARLKQVGRLVDDNIALMELGMREKRTKPRILMERIPAQIAAHVVSKPEESPYFAAFKEFSASIPDADRARIVAEARNTIQTVIVPAYTKLQTFFDKKYLPATRTSVGIWDTPEGGAYYQNRIHYFTTVKDLTADQIHEIGLKEVARIRGEMDKIVQQVGFKGSFAEFLQFLRTDPQFYYKTPEELLDGYRALTRRIDPELVKLFGKLPRTPYGVRPIPATSAPDTTTAYYQGPALDGTRAGYYYVNLYRPEVRPKYEMEVLSVHEAVPGHHLQIALQSELGELPMFRRSAPYTAYIEGWGLYSESLGDELGLYKDPYSKFGQLTYEMWRAVRLVVDTGMHHKKWSREQAIEYFKANAAKTEKDIVNEIDRYIDWPGQALAYKIGELKIKELRAQATRELGERFDVRRFHDTILGTGAVPLDVMERTVSDWVAREKQAPAAASAR
jgi:uncharacterized protein (DUF885 family)